MTHPVYPAPSGDLAARRAELAPATQDAFEAFSRQVFAEGALSEKAKQLIAVAVAHVTQCPYCIRSHTPLAQRKGAGGQEIMEAIWVAAEMRAGGAYGHSVIAVEATARDGKARPLTIDYHVAGAGPNRNPRVQLGSARSAASSSRVDLERLGEQPGEVEGIDAHRDASVLPAGPLSFGPIDHQLDPVSVRVAQVDGDVHAVVRGSLQPVAGLQDADYHRGERRLVW